MKHTLRSLARSPAFTATAIATLAVCLGANLTIFAVIDTILLRPLPFPESDQLVAIYNTYPKAGVDRDGASVTNYYERRGRVDAFSSLSVFREETAIVGNVSSPERIAVARVSPEFFTTVGVSLALGRAFEESETTYQTDNVAILTDAYWRLHLAADPHVLGREIRVDGLPRKIVGVLPPGFRFLSSEARLYFPRASDSDQRAPHNRHSGSSTLMIARLRPGVSLAEAQSQVDAHDASVAASYPRAKMIADAGFRSVVVSLHADHVRLIRPSLVLMQTGVLFLLLIGAVNLTNLLLTRASGRAKEIAIRQSMGASRRHVLAQTMIETITVTTAGGFAGVLVGAFGIDLLNTLGVDRLPLGAEVALNSRHVLLTLVGAILLGAAIALPVAWLNLRTHLTHALQSASRGATGGRSAQRLRHAFIVTQIALAFVLLSGAALLGLSLKRALSLSPGFRADHLLSGQLTLPWKSYGEAASLLSFAERLTTKLRQQPGISAAAVATNIPLSGSNIMSGVQVQGYVPPEGESVRGHFTYGVTGDYFAALGIQLLQGRYLEADDSRREQRVCVVDEDFARRYWPAGDALGQRLFLGGGKKSANEAFTVVGVVGAVKQVDVTDTRTLGAAYVPLKFRSDLSLFFVARSQIAPEMLGPIVQQLVRQLDPELPVHDLRTMSTRVDDSLIARRSSALLTGVFAGIALLLAALGTYGVLSYAVSQREREIGVRIALGAQPRQIRQQFLSIGVRLLTLGTAIGFAGAWLTGRSMQNVLFEVPTLHLPTLAGTAALLAAVSLLACLLPVRRATKVDPLIALRSE